MAREVTSQKAVIIVPNTAGSIFSVHCPAGLHAETSQIPPVFSAKDDSASPDGSWWGERTPALQRPAPDPVRPVL